MPDGEAENVKVAVRVRPFNKREKARNAKLIVEMKGNQTILQNPEEPDNPKKFTFDFSYWSHDGFVEEAGGYLASDGSIDYCDQRRVYNDLGKGVLKNAWDGYNTSLFAYGQTGSGKSWSIVGYGANKGIVPMFCEEIFEGIKAKKAEGDAAQFEVSFSMLEIYNEQVRDLLNPKSNKKGGLKVRQHPKKGFYPDGLLTTAVNSYADIEARMEEGTTNRTVASTNMNATSSRAHTVVGVTLTQKRKNEAGEETAKVSLINLVDLAGSERADSTGATGDRLKEGAAINQSLSSLGNVISALVDKANGKNIRVPYRDSVLTKLLKNALGGNSKTMMIAAISPADINYDETLSTLRYADRAKQIKTSAKVNEDPTEKLIRELQEQNAKLQEMLQKAQNGQAVKIPTDDDDDDDDDEASKGLSEEELAELRKQIEEELRASMAQTEREMEDMNKSWEDKVAEAGTASSSKEEQRKAREATPHLWNLNPDPQLTGMIAHLLKPGTTKVGNKKAEPAPDVVLVGLNIQKEHCYFTVQGGKVTVVPCGDARVLVNGEPISEGEELHHLDRVMFGTSHLYVFHSPTEAPSSPVKLSDITFESAQDEIAQNSGFGVDDDEEDRDAALLREDLADLLPLVEQANAISQELDKKVVFELVVVPAKALGLSSGRPEPHVVMKNLQTGQEWLWSRTKFVNRAFPMQEMYQDYEEGEEWQVPDEKDPFTESPDTEVFIGCVEVSLQSLGYVLDMREQLSVTDFRGREVGYLNIEVVPLNEQGKEITENDDIFVDSPQDLLNKKLDFIVRILSMRGVPKKIAATESLYCKFSVDIETGLCTEKVSGTANPDFNYQRRFTFERCTQHLIDYLMKTPVMIQVWGKHAPSKKPVNKAALLGKDTKAIMRTETIKKGMARGTRGEATKDFQNATEMAMMKRRKEQIERKMAHIRQLCQQREAGGYDSIPIKDLRAIIGDQNANTKPGTHGHSTSQPGRNQESATCAIL